MKRKNLSGRPVIVSVAVIAVMAAGVTVALATSSLRAPGPVGEPIAAEDVPPPRPQVKAVSTAQGRLSVLRRARDAGDNLSPALQDIMRGRIGGENPALARRAITTALKRSYYVVPGQDGLVCLVGEGGGGGCSPVKEILAGSFVGTETCVAGRPDLFGVSGMVADGASEVSVHYSDGSQRTIEVRNNVFAFETAKDGPLPQTASYQTASSGAVTVDLAVPKDISQFHCATVPAG